MTARFIRAGEPSVSASESTTSLLAAGSLAFGCTIVARSVVGERRE
jgi:hypothetical protein